MIVGSIRIASATFVKLPETKSVTGSGEDMIVSTINSGADKGAVYDPAVGKEISQKSSVNSRKKSGKALFPLLVHPFQLQQGYLNNSNSRA